METALSSSLAAFHGEIVDIAIEDGHEHDDVFAKQCHALADAFLSFGADIATPPPRPPATTTLVTDASSSGFHPTAEWLVSRISSLDCDRSNGMSLWRTCSALVDACGRDGPDAVLTAVLEVLGEGEAEFDLAVNLILPHAEEIQNGIREEDLRRVSGEEEGENVVTPSDAGSSSDLLVEEYRIAATEAALARVALDSVREAGAEGGSVGTHRAVDKGRLREAEKEVKRTAKLAAEKLRVLRESGTFLPEMLENIGGGKFDTDTLRHELSRPNGLKGASEEDLAAMRAELLPQGTKEWREKKGLPPGTVREYDDEHGCERVTVPAALRNPAKLHPRIPISKEHFPTPQMRAAFKGTDSLNPLQSAVYEAAFRSQENLLVCAPTGAGKTNVAMLTVVAHLRDRGIIPGAINPYAAYDHIRNDNDEPSNSNSNNTKGNKIVYIAPMKALAQEVVEKFDSRLRPIRVITRELTGDMQLTRAEADSADIIVTTPEKWDVVTRKGGDGSLSQSCGLLIIDEVHLLADDRGAVIESVVARSHRLVESSQRQLRIVGLSATLPNYEDVADFLKVDRRRGLFFFGPEHRPVPLEQTFVGITEKKRFAREKKADRICYDVVVDALRRGHQVMVFVHSRKGTGATCEALREIASTKGDLESVFLTQGTDAHTRHADAAAKSRNRELSHHYENGMGIHHAGMLRNDRKLTERAFADGAIKVLCCTATLAWGINLPAHSVVIKGTDVYNPEKGGTVDLSILDVMQIFGRAGRPQYDTSGEATLITSHAAMVRYLDRLVHAVPIESNFIKQLADHLNAEVVAGTVCNVDEAVEWLTYTYLYVRLVRNPLAYGVSADEKADDPSLQGRCRDLVCDAAKLLDERRMLRYDVDSGNLAVTDLGRVASHFYVRNESVATFHEELSDDRDAPTDAACCLLVCRADEFENVRVRPEEADEMDALVKSACPLEVPIGTDEFAGKCDVLLQTYVSRAKVRSFTLISDTNYVAANAGRIARALFEMCLKRGAAVAAARLLRIANSVDRRTWWFRSPLRQFEEEKIPPNVFNALETRLQGSSSVMDDTLSLLDMQPNEVGQFVRWNKGGKTIQNLVRTLPRLDVDCQVQPVTRGVLRFKVTLTPNFRWSPRYHKSCQAFWLWVEDGENNRIYHHENILFSRRTHPEPIDVEMTIPAFEPLPPQYYVRVISDSWVGCEVLCPVSFQHVLLPHRGMSYTNLVDLTPLPKTALAEPKFEALYPKFETFNPIQTQLFHVLYHTDDPVLLGAPTGSGKTIVAEIALLRMKRLNKHAKCVYIAPLKSLARERLKEWRSRFSKTPLRWKVLELSGDTHHDNRTMNNADVLVCTPEKWDLITRGWRGNESDDDTFSTNCPTKGKRFIRQVGLLIMDEIHLLGEERGAVLEAIVSRTRFISMQLKREQELASSEEKNNDPSSPSTGKMMTTTARIMGLSTALANPHDLADWMGINVTGHTVKKNRGLYNFRPSVRPIPMEVHIQGFPGRHYCPRMATMNKPCYAAIKEHSRNKPVIIFVASRRQTRLTALDLISYAAGDENPGAFLGCDDRQIEAVSETISDAALRHTMLFGVGLHHAGLSSRDRDVVEKMFLKGDIQILVATATLAWGVNLPAHLVIVKGTEFFDGKTSRYKDYPVTDVLQMMGRAGRPQFDTHGIACVMVAEAKKNFYKKFLYEPFPVESCLDGKMCETLNAEVAIGTIKCIDDAVGYLGWTFFARRVKMNPSFYGAKSDSKDDINELFLRTVTHTMQLLQDQKCVVVHKDQGVIDGNFEIEPTVLGKTASNFYLQYQTPIQMEIGMRNVRNLIWQSIENDLRHNNATNDVINDTLLLPIDIQSTAVANVLYTISHLHEFDDSPPVRHNEELLNKSLSDQLPWGADLKGLMVDKKSTSSHQTDMDIFGSPHTKCFLLLQAYIKHAQLPISDYINDTRSVMDQIPRLLAAMQCIALDDTNVGGSFEVFCLFSTVRQVISSRIMVDENTLGQIPGISEYSVQQIVRKHGVKSLSELKKKPHAETFRLIRNVLQGKGRGGSISSVDNALEFLCRIPTLAIRNSSLRTEVEKSSGTITGHFSFELVIKKEGKMKRRTGRKKNDNDFENGVNLIVALGTLRRKLLSHKSVRYNYVEDRQVKEISMSFDWKLANAEGGDGAGKMIVRAMQENVLGCDLEKVVLLTKE